MAKIVIIGAGSLGFSSRLTADILSYPATSDAHFALCDINEERLEYAGKIIERIFKEGGYDKATYSLSSNRRDLLEGADYVILSILVGGFEAIEKEIDIPMKYGVDQCIGDTIGVGGVMRCLRTLPTKIDIANDIMELCPKATVLNYTNPMSMLCWGMKNAQPDLKLVGLCHSVQGTSQQWADRLDVKLDDVNFECAGINHQAWIYRFEKDGVDLLPQIREAALKPETWVGDTTRMEYVKHFGIPVTESSGHNSEYSAWWRKKPQYIKDYCTDKFNGGSGYIKELYDRKDWREQMEKRANWETPVDLERSIEYGSQIINSIETGERVIIHGNVMNHNSLIDNLPGNCNVEVPIFVDKNGLQPIRVGNAIPDHLAAINKTQINVQELAVKAATESCPESLFHALALDPLTAAVCTLDQIREMSSELLEAHRPYLPNFEGKSVAKKPYMVGTVVQKAETHKDQADKNMA